MMSRTSGQQVANPEVVTARAKEVLPKTQPEEWL